MNLPKEPTTDDQFAMFSKRMIGATAVVAAMIVAGVVALVVHARLGAWEGVAMREDPEAILTDATVRKPVLALGRRVYDRRCESCHSADGRGGGVAGVPDLTDHDYLLSSSVQEVEQITLHGIRAGVSKTQGLSYMPAFATAKPYGAEPLPSLAPRDIDDTTAYLLAVGGRWRGDPASAQRGGEIFRTRGGCWDCHSRDGSGDDAIGAPNLRDAVWLYGGSPAAIHRSIAYGRRGVSPAFERTISPVEARAVSVYVVSLSANGRKAGG